jgi:hypothetical protein
MVINISQKFQIFFKLHSKSNNLLVDKRKKSTSTDLLLIGIKICLKRNFA